jgi:hypothetical protein
MCLKLPNCSCGKLYTYVRRTTLGQLTHVFCLPRRRLPSRWLYVVGCWKCDRLKDSNNDHDAQQFFRLLEQRLAAEYQGRNNLRTVPSDVPRSSLRVPFPSDVLALGNLRLTIGQESEQDELISN